MPSTASRHGTRLRQLPFAAPDLDQAAFFHRLQRKGYCSAADLLTRRLDMPGDLGRRNGAVLGQDFGDRRADGLARPGRAFRLWPAFRIRRRRGFERQELTLGDTKIGEPRLEFGDFRADALDGCVHDPFANRESYSLQLRLFHGPVRALAPSFGVAGAVTSVSNVTKSISRFRVFVWPPSDLPSHHRPVL
jgi:hypothetical protein